MNTFSFYPKKILLNIFILVYLPVESYCQENPISSTTKLLVSEGFENPFIFYDASLTSSHKFLKNVKSKTAFSIIATYEVLNLK